MRSVDANVKNKIKKDREISKINKWNKQKMESISTSKAGLSTILASYLRYYVIKRITAAQMARVV